MISRGGRLLELCLFSLAVLFFWFGFGALSLRDTGFETGRKEPGVLRVMTWNVGTGVDAGTGALRDADLDAVAQAIAECAPDLVFLQELEDRGQLSQIGRSLGPGCVWRYASTSSGRPLGVLALSGSLKQLGASQLERALVVVYTPDSGPVLHCVALHADAFSSANRNRVIGQASDYLRDTKVVGMPVLLGDLNLDLGIDKRRDLFTDDEYLDVETYNYVANRLLDSGLESGPTAKPDRRIDYIFIPAESLNVSQVGPWLGRRSRGMDHHPLVLDVSLSSGD